MNISAIPTIRPATPEDAQHISQLAIRSKAVWGYNDESMAVFRDELTLSAHDLAQRTAYVLQNGSGLHAYYTLTSTDDQEVELEHLFVDPQHLRKGYGTLLYRHAIRTARQAGFARMRILADPHAAGFYQSQNAVLARDIPSSIPGRTLPLFQVALTDSAVCVVGPIDETHLDSAADLFDAYRQYYGQDGDLERARLFLQERLERQQSAVLLAMRGTTAVGFTQLYPSFSSISLARVFILNDLYVASASRRTGVGRWLLRGARDFAAETGAIRLELATMVDNTAAQALYEANDWQRNTTFVHYTLQNLKPQTELSEQ